MTQLERTRGLDLRQELQNGGVLSDRESEPLVDQGRAMGLDPRPLPSQFRRFCSTRVHGLIMPTRLLLLTIGGGISRCPNYLRDNVVVPH